ncbi:dipeptide ABC transporter ATP-binding protein [Kitasatospora sp. YST-16]|uniref:dipeptide ABC transporter ATP-binding protein n=1 Tax=Kitasatospora sp. YST-16 TaxID=2998080 RepID=UPI00228338C5|nr:dipeptide ABC transporter ATP-binding protein [Kitasatospora sp. YST-16]WAL70071.1 dipeptide ABC transporter ATP-binding protein [Kitasatospora sp. YST-16]WAL76138.1 dipeptide ABC transporter ATP-binding protein [Kitasatospora sp. YST-16]WNW36110.1 dipeptide ABC transporter ATP-binding protein [Streptomyces sp. Li-HN-5-13]WNW42192.1 dipeptide ABC transporter ATP-binding protein [Streptomyces sp. Li-HN-5-13]
MTTPPTALPTTQPSAPLLAVRDLTVDFGGHPAVRGVDLELHRGETLGLVGESGSGKSVTALAVLGLLPATARTGGSVRLDGRELLGLPARQLAAVRGRRIAMVFQDPLSAFTPVHRIGDQLAEAVRVHQDLGRAAARKRATDLLDLVGIPDPARALDAFPHEFSGGMRQRAMIAMAVANDPDVLLADEPTTALDVTIQAQVLEVLRTAQRETGAALVLVSHDLGVIAGSADRVAVMYAGRIVETAPVDDLFATPRHPYTLGLIGAVPRLDGPGRALVPIPGAPPATGEPPTPGCAFAARCPLVEDRCHQDEPPLTALAGPAPSGPPAAVPADGAAPPGPAAHLAACVRAAHLAAVRPAPAEVYPVPELPAAAVRPRAERPDVLTVRGLTRSFPQRRGGLLRRRAGEVHAVDGVDLDIRQGETLGLVGESGSGKSTTLYEILRLAAPQGGRIELLGQDTAALDRAAARRLRSRVQIVFQDPAASLDPRMPIGDVLAEPLLAQRTPAAEARRRVPELLRQVGLDPAHADRYPHEFSGGQRQRISIARALAVRPDLLALDEPVSALDVSVQAGVLNLLQRLKAELGLAYLFVSHDLSVVRHLADRVAVMYLGRTVETGAADRVFTHPRHPYTRALLAAVPRPEPVAERTRPRHLLAGDPPSPTTRHPGCPFRARCPVQPTLTPAQRDRCATEPPPALPAAPGVDHTAACHYPD